MKHVYLISALLIASVLPAQAPKSVDHLEITAINRRLIQAEANVHDLTIALTHVTDILQMQNDEIVDMRSRITYLEVRPAISVSSECLYAHRPVNWRCGD